MRFAVTGAGAVGCYYGARLALSGHEVMLIGRSALVEAVRIPLSAREALGSAGRVQTGRLENHPDGAGYRLGDRLSRRPSPGSPTAATGRHEGV